MKTISQLLSSDLPPIDIVEPIGHRIIDKAEAEACNMAQLTEPENVVLVLWGFYGLAMNHPLEEALRISSQKALNQALRRIGMPHIATALASPTPKLFATHQHEILSCLLDYIRANQEHILCTGA